MAERSAIDLHAHSSASDGALSPRDLVDFATGRRLKVLALTDHDCLDGIAEASAAAAGRLQLVPGIELSTMWRNFQIHVVGLFIDCQNPKLLAHLKKQRIKREERAHQIAQMLERCGFEQAYERTKAQAQPGACLTRGNYARFIASTGVCRSSDEAFNKYLKRGRPAYVKTQWGCIEEGVEVILAADGIPVLAHPRRYQMTNTKLRELIALFKSAGGTALEVASAQQRPADRQYLADLCQRFDLLASVGSDFHAAGTWRDPGLNLILPDKCQSLWQSERYADKFYVHEQRMSMVYADKDNAVRQMI